MRIHLLNPMMCRDGGADVYSELLAAGLIERGHEVSIICKQASAEIVERYNTVVLPIPDYDQWPGLWRAAPYLRWRRWQRSIARLDLPRPDALICSKGFCSSALVRRFPRVPLIYLPHSRIDPLEIEQMLPPDASWIQRKLACTVAHVGERWSLLHAAATVRFTASNVADLRDYYRLPARVRFEVIPAGIAAPARAPAKLPSADVRLLGISRLVETKNLAFLLRTLASLPQHNWRLDLVGDGPERANLERLAAGLGLADRVCFHGFQHNPQRFYAHADLHVFPSRLESLGLVVLEAMAHGVPTLAIKADGQRYRNANHELITHQTDGWLADNEAEFARLLQTCIAQPSTLSALSRGASQTYADRHQCSAVSDRWDRLLRAIVTTSQAAAAGRTAPPHADLLTPSLPDMLSATTTDSHAYVD